MSGWDQPSAPPWYDTGAPEGRDPGPPARRGARVAGHGERRRRRWVRVLLVCLVVLVGLLVAADRIGAVYAEHRIANEVQTKLAGENIHTSGTPSVSIGGFPFLTQVLAGDYGQIDIDVPSPSSLGVRLDALHIRATDVHAPLSTVMHGGAIVAGNIGATARIDWANLQNIVDLSSLSALGVDTSSIKVTTTGGGRISLSAPITTAGVHYSITASGTVSVRDGLLHVELSAIAPGSLPSVLAGHAPDLPSHLSLDTRIPALPYGLKIDSVTTSDDGVQVSGNASNVTLG